MQCTYNALPFIFLYISCVQTHSCIIFFFIQQQNNEKLIVSETRLNFCIFQSQRINYKVFFTQYFIFIHLNDKSLLLMGLKNENFLPFFMWILQIKKLFAIAKKKNKNCWICYSYSTNICYTKNFIFISSFFLGDVFLVMLENWRDKTFITNWIRNETFSSTFFCSLN